MTRPWLLIETATSQALVGLADADGALVGSEAWHSSHRHGEELLARLDALLVAAAIGRRDLGGVAVGTGPGSFTGLRIGLATAKTIAFSLGVPIVGLPTMASLALSAGDGEWSVALPAGV
ncbi:MAG TPA: tRNA (adenosine(37)-N6)-threonylcarbamoyltransferase complex dimerization subunit type 1 TsaB, partial [Candidatus Limnocylindrales bacterium]